MNPLNHVAIIMDGNGRWGLKYKNSRNAGHKAGLHAVEKIIKETINQKIKYLTLYAFSTENWKRPKKEISTIMRLIVLVLKKELKTMMDNKIKLETIGDLEKLPENVKSNLIRTVNKTKNNNKLTLTVAINYGGKEDISNAFKLLLEKVKNNIISPKKIDELIINNHLYTRNLPDVDLLIRTSGEQRISNFLLWQIAYAELYFTDVYWPDFGKKDFYKALFNYQKRERRFGKTSGQINF